MIEEARRIIAEASKIDPIRYADVINKANELIDEARELIQPEWMRVVETCSQLIQGGGAPHERAARVSAAQRILRTVKHA
jgi:hypothetical protein